MGKSICFSGRSRVERRGVLPLVVDTVQMIGGVLTTISRRITGDRMSVTTGGVSLAGDYHLKQKYTYCILVDGRRSFASGRRNTVDESTISRSREGERIGVTIGGRSCVHTVNNRRSLIKVLEA